MSKAGDDIWAADVGRLTDAQFHADRLKRAAEQRPQVTKVTVCGKSPMKIELLCEPIARSIVDDQLVGLLRYCKAKHLRLEIFRSRSDTERVRCIVHWRCCYREVPQ